MRILPWVFMGTIWVAWITALTTAFLHESCVGCTQLRILLVLFIAPVTLVSVAVLRGWFGGGVAGGVYMVGGALLALLLLALLALTG